VSTMSLDTRRFAHKLISHRSRRQYILQFQKWGLQKYNTTIREQGKLRTELFATAPLSQSTPFVFEQELAVGNDPLKRRHSFQSLQSDRSTISRAAATRKKKQRYEQDLEPPRNSAASPGFDVVLVDFDSHVPYQNYQQSDAAGVSCSYEKHPNFILGVSNPTDQELLVLDNFDISRRGSVSIQKSTLLEDSSADGQMFTSAPSIKHTTNTVGERHFSEGPVEETRFNSSLPIHNTRNNQYITIATETRNTVKANAVSLPSGGPSVTESVYTCSDSTQSEFSLPERWKYVDELVRVARQVDPNCPIESFSGEEISNMKMAADYLSVLNFDDEACYLYALVAKRFRAEHRTQTSEGLSTIVNFAKTAFNNTDRDIILNLLHELLNGESDSLKIFLWHMMRAFIKSRTNPSSLPPDALSGLEDLGIAREIYEAEDILALLPNYTRALDLVTYHHLLRSMLWSPVRYKPHNWSDVFEMSWEKFQEYRAADKLTQQLMQRTPGPFEIEGKSMKNPCLRSCLAWCINELPQVRSIPGCWKRTHLPKFKFRWWIKKVEGEDQILSQKLAEANALFTCLWDRSRNPLKSSFEPYESNACQWINESDKRMGLSPAELLYIVCSLGFMANTGENNLGWEVSNKSRVLVNNTIKRLQRAFKLDDEALVLLFLDEYLGQNRCITWSEFKYAEREISRAHVYDICRKTMMIIVPERVSIAFSATGSPRMALAELLPTLAPPLDSESLRMMKGKWNRSISNLSLSLNAAAHRSVNNPSISQLSDRLTNSLRISK
jgi:hypothetical protein